MRQPADPSTGAHGIWMLLRYVRPFRTRFAAAVVASIISMSFGLAFPWLVGRLLAAASPMIEHLPKAEWMRDPDIVALVLVGTLAIQAGLTFLSSYWFNRAGEGAVVNLRAELYERLLHLPMRFYGEHRVGELASRLSNDLALIQDTLTFIVAAAIRQTILLIGGVTMIAVTSLQLSLAMISTFPVLILIAVVVGRRIRHLSRAAQDCLAESAVVVEETLQGIANVKAFTNEGFEGRRYRAALDAFFVQILRSARSRAALIAFIIVGIFGSIVLVLWYGARLMKSGQLTHPDLTTFMLYTLFVGGAVSSFAEIISQVQKAAGASGRVQELLKEPMEESVPENTHPVVLRGRIRFEDVSFRYPSRPDLPVLRNISLEANPGERIALVGPSGAGKSTLVSLLLRFYEPDSGQLILDDQAASSLSIRAVRENIAIVPQEVILFGGSIRENIAYGRPEAGEQAIRAAAQRAHCAEFVERFPEGYDTLVGDRGVKLSGGQRQRIAIARAFLRDPRILIFDEATSSLDSESEALIQEALATLLEGRTAVIIAHRLATVRRVDCIYVLENGMITEQGAHDALMSREGGTYRRLAELQFGT
ncbi:MAG: ABC transporter transmembrane domain-containing protein [Chthoniobacteraceae bacterium]